MCSGTQERSVSARGKVPKGLPALAWQDHAGKSIARRWAVTRGNGVKGRQLQLEEHCGPPAYRRGCAHASPCERT
jgi:hypothetical protein